MAAPLKQIFVRADRCTGCHTCEMMCAIEHSQSKTLWGAVFEKPVPKKRLYVEIGQQEGAVPVVCRMCEDAPCLNACISGSLYREPETGLVLRNADKCIGCWTCIMTCPFGVVGRMERRGKLVSARCDRCHENSQGPQCVAACPTKALVYATPEEFASLQREGFAQLVRA